MNLKDIFLFKDLDDTLIKKIEDNSKVIKLQKDNILFYEGDESNNMYVLLSGIIKLYKVVKDDKELLLKFFHANELIAEVANFEGINYPATAVAINDCEVLAIDFNSLKEYIFSDAKFSYKIITSLVKKIKNLENIVSTNLVLDTTGKVARYLYEYGDEFFSTKNIIIAQILNMEPETLSRTLKKFKDKNIIDIKNKKIDKKTLKLYFD